MRDVSALEPNIRSLVQRIEDDIKHYDYNRRQIEQIERRLKQMDARSMGGPRSKLCATYGIDAIMPRSTAPDLDDDAEWFRLLERLAKLREKVYRIDRAAAAITEPRERELLQLLLEGYRMEDAATELGIKPRWAWELKKRIVIFIAERGIYR